MKGSIGVGQWNYLAPELQRGAAIGDAIRRAIDHELGISVTVGVSRNKLLARLVSPIHKPDAMTFLPDEHIPEFVCRQRLQSISGFGGKAGEAICRQLSIQQVCSKVS